jgi:hypothetical protein
MIPARPCFSAVDPLGFIVDSLLVGYDGTQKYEDWHKSKGSADHN